MFQKMNIVGHITYSQNTICVTVMIPLTSSVCSGIIYKHAPEPEYL